MEYKKSIIMIMLTIFLFAIAGVHASDANDTLIASDDNNQMELSLNNQINEDNLQTSEDNVKLTRSYDNETVNAKIDSEILGSGEGTFSDLRNDISNGGKLTKSYYRYSNGDGDTIFIENPMIIDGNGAVIDMAGFNIQALYVTASDVVIKNLTIKNGNYDRNGGAILFESVGAVENCNFVNNTASDWYGGALYFLKTGNVTNCNFTNNSAHFGGAINMERDGSVINCNFANNTATYRGGAIWISSGRVENCNFDNNKAASDESLGGAIWSSSARVENCNFTNNNAQRGAAGYFISTGTLENCNFTNNTAIEYGGALYFLKTGNVTNCNFTNNKAAGVEGWGGAIYFSKKGNVTNCNFANNTANDGRGGAIWSSSARVENCNFTANTALFWGGAIYCDGIGDVTNCNFANNTATNGRGGAIWISSGRVQNCNATDNKAADFGGAIYFDGMGEVTNCNFANNTAYEGGAIFFNSKGDVENCNFTKNTARQGGAIYYEYGAIGTLVNCNFANNSAVNRGGAIRMYSGTVENCNFNNNKAIADEGLGGAIYFSSSRVTGRVENSNFVNNSAGSNGGAIDFEGSGTIINSNFTNDSAAYSGGAIWFGENGDVANCNFIDNKVTDNHGCGGAVYTYSGNFENCNFTNNAAGDLAGSILFTWGGNVTNCNFANNSAGNRGGAILFNRVGNAVNSNFVNNHASNHGGAIYLDLLYSATGELAANAASCTFINNTAANGGAIYGANATDCIFTANAAELGGAIYGIVNINTTEYICIFKTQSDTLYNTIIIPPILTVSDFNSVYGSGEKLVLSNLTTPDGRILTGKDITVKIFKNNTELFSFNCSSDDGWVVNLSAGTYIAQCNPTGYMSAPINATLTITKANSTLTVDDFEFDYGTVGSTTVSFTNATGFSVELINLPKAIVNVTGNIISISNVDVGTYIFMVTTITDENHKSVTETARFKVNKVKTQLEANAIEAMYNASEYLLITLTDINGNPVMFADVDVDLNGTQTFTSDKNGQIKVPTKGLLPKFYSVNITYGGDFNHLGSNATTAVHINKIDTFLSANDVNATYDKGYLIVGLNDIYGNPMAGFNITVVLNGINNYTTDEKGTLNLSIKGLNPDTYVAVISFYGNEIYSPSFAMSTITISKMDTPIELDVETFDDKAFATVRMNPNATGFVKFEVTGDTKYTFYMDVLKGKSSCDNFLEPGNYTITATYLGDLRFNTNTTSKDFTITGHIKKNTSIEASSSVDGYTVTITANVDVHATGYVAISISGRTVVVPVNEGEAVFTYDFLPGTYEADVIYVGDNDFNNATTTVSFTVTEQVIDLKDTPIDVEVSTKANDVTITATVDATASGLVEFNIGGKSVYIAVNNGEAIYETVLPAGNYTVDVTYLGNIRFNPNRTSMTFSVSDYVKQNATLKSDVVVDDNTVSITASVDVSATGFVEFVIAGNSYYAPVVDGRAVLVSDFLAGTYSGNVNYLGDEQFNPASTVVYFTVIEHNATLDNTSIDVSVGAMGNDVSIIVSVNESATGLVEFVIEDKVVYVPVNNGEAIYETVLAGGNYTVRVTYMGDSNFNANSTSKDFTVTDPVKLNTTVNCDVSVDDNEVSVVANVDLNASGFVEFVIAGNSYYAPVNDGRAVLVSDFLAGTYSGNVNYLGDEQFNPASTVVYFTVIEHNATLDNTSIDVVVGAMGNDVSIIAVVNGSATGLVEFVIGDSVVYVPVNNGEAIYEVVLAGGDYTVRVTYMGDSNFNANSTSREFSVIDPVKLNTTVNCDVSVDGYDVIVTANVDSNASGFVEFVIAGNRYYAPVVEGRAVLDSYFPAGTFSGNVNYLGDELFNPASTVVYFTVIEHNATLDNTSIDVVVGAMGNDVSIIAVVNGSATGLVEFVIGDSVVYVPVNNGEAVYEVVLAGGNYTVRVTYMGDSSFNANSTSKDFTVTDPVKLNTTVNCDVIVDDNEVSVIANVDSNAGGFVEFVIAGNSYYAPVVDGKAVLVSDFLAGTYSGNVNYLGDEQFNPASTIVYFTVIEQNGTLENTSIILDVSVDKNNVTAVAGINPAATGFVQFDIGGKVVYIAVNNGNAVYDLVLPSGDYNVTATYLGDAKFNSNTATKSFNITDAPVVVPIASEFSDIVISDDLSISVVLKDANGNPIADVPIKYIINGIANATVTDIDGKFTIKAQSGDEINISYEGNATIIGTSTTLKLNASVPPSVIKLATRFAIDSNPSVTSITINGYAVDTKAGEKGIFYSTVLFDDNGKPMANVPMNFAVNNKIYNRTTYENGSFRPYQLDMIRAGRYTMALYYAGDEAHNATLACVCFDLDKKPITIKAAAKTYKVATKTKKYTVTLKTIAGSSHDGKAHLRSGLKVTLKVNGKTFTGKTNSKGQVTFKITNLKKKAKYVAKISYAGDKTYESATKNVKLTVK